MPKVFEMASAGGWALAGGSAVRGIYQCDIDRRNRSGVRSVAANAGRCGGGKIHASGSDDGFVEFAQSGRTAFAWAAGASQAAYVCGGQCDSRGEAPAFRGGV